MQPGKSLYTTVRELLENSLDSVEDIGELPDITITMCAVQGPGWRGVAWGSAAAWALACQAALACAGC